MGTIATDSDFIEVRSGEYLADQNLRTLWFTMNDRPQMHVIQKVFRKEDVDSVWRREVIGYIQEMKQNRVS